MELDCVGRADGRLLAGAWCCAHSLCSPLLSSLRSATSADACAQLRHGLASAGRSAAFGGVLLAGIEGIGILITRMTAPPPPPGLDELVLAGAGAPAPQAPGASPSVGRPGVVIEPVFSDAPEAVLSTAGGAGAGAGGGSGGGGGASGGAGGGGGGGGSRWWSFGGGGSSRKAAQGGAGDSAGWSATPDFGFSGGKA